MILPLQAQPVMRTVSAAKISKALMSGVTASACDWGKCLLELGKCGGSPSCVGIVTFTDCLGCTDILGPPQERWRRGTML